MVKMDRKIITASVFTVCFVALVVASFISREKTTQPEHREAMQESTTEQFTEEKVTEEEVSEEIDDDEIESEDETEYSFQNPDYLFTNPAGAEFEHVRLYGTVVEEPKVTGDDYRYMVISTDDGNIAWIALGENKETFRKGDYVWVKGEVAGQTEVNGKNVPIIDDSTVVLEEEYENSPVEHGDPR